MRHVSGTLDSAVKEYPDGRRESVRFSRQGNEVIRIL
ncbi:hypothetical protein AvCA_08890 [Azotobacter vinelandii CA]|uniref:Uncharacterized protein n=2 Tax=Azotobacter vinelandii TaxID=354 RepID=C1DMU9_AZOVD|nr:hypothetical protein Avin_08890 [Azotobacter vinelandii DJ]AGK15480.1 hypothetical protein AvCA_08890 [Azotobacter vinelandii CA]AGK19573.1 hypothetical protein AvCA6_08890 [Azotobacter vinelandii CA6]